MQSSTGHLPPGLPRGAPTGQWGYGVETSFGKDTPSGHWEIAGTPVRFDWGYFPRTVPALPRELSEALIAEGDLPGILGDKHASGMEVIEELGEEHLLTSSRFATRRPIRCFRSPRMKRAFGLERLYALCKIATPPLRSAADRPRHRAAVRRANRRATSRAPPIARISRCRRRRTICWSAPRKPAVRSSTIGKIGDIFAHRHTGRELKGASNDGSFRFDLVGARRGGATAR